MKRAELDPAEHCRHATKAHPLVRGCWNLSRGDPCMYCARMERESQERAQAREDRCNTETYYEYLRRTRGSRYCMGNTFAYWAADLYAEAACDVERALALLAEWGSGDAEDDKLLEADVRLMPTLARDHMHLWLAMLDQLGVPWRKDDASAPSTPAQARTHAGSKEGA